MNDLGFRNGEDSSELDTTEHLILNWSTFNIEKYNDRCFKPIMARIGTNSGSMN